MFNKADWLILAAAFLSFVLSVFLWFGLGISTNKEAGLFVGLWVPSILSAGNTSVRQQERSAMSDTVIFFVGLFAFLLLFGGFGFTLLEVRRSEKEGTAKRQSKKVAGTGGG